MRHGRVVGRTLMAGFLTALAFAIGMSLPGTTKLGLGGPALAQDGFAIEQFYDELAPYGEWVHHPTHGYVWLPISVVEGWRPYTNGQWIYTDEYGWYWNSYEPFAWAVYHYGRWGFDPGYGWYWVPGDTWAPAWVLWRYGTDHVGWAPIGPNPYGGYAYGGQAHYAPPPMEAWVFVRPDYLTSPTIAANVLPPRDTYAAFGRATTVYRPEFRNGYVYNYGMPRGRWSRLTRQHIEPRKIYRGGHRTAPYGWSKSRERELYVYAPSVWKGVKPSKRPKKVSHKPSKKWATQYNGGPGVVNPNLRGPGSTVINPNARFAPKDAWKPNASTSKTSKAKSSNAKSSSGKASNSKSSKDKAGKAKHDNGLSKARVVPRYAKPKSVNPNAVGSGSTVINPNARFKPDSAVKPKAATAKSSNGAHAKDKGKAKSAKPKEDKTKPKGSRAASGGGNGNGGKAKGGLDRSALCKARPDAPQCQQRGS